jgi:hypothetical protein
VVLIKLNSAGIRPAQNRRFGSFAFSAGVMMSATIPSGTVAITAKLRHHLFEDAALPTNTHRSQTAMSST